MTSPIQPSYAQNPKRQAPRKHTYIKQKQLPQENQAKKPGRSALEKSVGVDKKEQNLMTSSQVS